MVIVETTVWVDYLARTSNAHTVWFDDHLDNENFGLTDLILCEVLQGIKDNKMFQKTLDRLTLFALFANGGEEIAVASAKNYRFLRAKGVTVRKTVDCLIATFCIANGFALLHRDRDYDSFEEHLGLKVIRPHPLVQ